MRVSSAQMSSKIQMKREGSSRCEHYKKELPQISFKKKELPSLPGFLGSAVGNWGFVGH